MSSAIFDPPFTTAKPRSKAYGRPPSIKMAVLNRPKGVLVTGWIMIALNVAG